MTSKRDRQLVIRRHVITKTTFIFFAIFSFITFLSYGQDTLVFYKSKNHEKVFKLPLGEFEVKVKTKSGGKKRAIITEYTDTTITMKIWTNKKNDTLQKRQMLELKTATLDKTFDLNQYNKKLQAIQFEKEEKVKLDDIKSIVINNWKRKEKKKSMSALGITKAIWTLGFPFALVLTGGNPYVFISSFSLSIVLFIIDPIVETKRVNFNKWSIQRGGRHE